MKRALYLPSGQSARLGSSVRLLAEDGQHVIDYPPMPASSYVWTTLKGSRVTASQIGKRTRAPQAIRDELLVARVRFDRRGLVVDSDLRQG